MAGSAQRIAKEGRRRPHPTGREDEQAEEGMTAGPLHASDGTLVLEQAEAGVDDPGIV